MNKPVAFMSYAHRDDESGHLSQLRKDLRDEVGRQLGEDFEIFQDQEDIKWGENWKKRIEDSLDGVTFLIPIITPSFFNSEHCRDELQRFLAREERLDRDDLILPIYYIDSPFLNNDAKRATDELAQIVADRQRADWRDLRFEPFDSPRVRKTLSQLATQICIALERAREEEERRKRLDELYTQARRSHQDQEWQAVFDLFDQIHVLDPAYPDPEGLLVSAREALEQARRVATAYDRGLRHGDFTDGPEDTGSRSTSPWEYVDLELEIREGDRPKYPVVVRSARGEEVREEMHFPFDEQELEGKLDDLEKAVLLSGTRRRRIRLPRRIRSPERQIVQNFGQALFQALFHGQVRASYNESLRKARQQNKGLRLKLSIQPPELTQLPWEFLYDSDQGEFLCLSAKRPLVRHVDLRQHVEPVLVTPPLRILGMVVSPLDLDPLDVEHEKELVEEATKDLQADGMVELTWLEGQTWRDLQHKLRDGSWHIFHFIGHGGFDPDSEEGLIALADKEGNARFLSAENLAELLKDSWDLRLVLLNSCEGARGSEHDAFSSTAAALVRLGTPAVLAMQYEITDEAAVEFSHAFYEAVADGLPLDAAVAGARTSLKIELDDTLEWVTPVLYMLSPDGRIFDIKKGPEGGDSLTRYRECVESAWADGELHEREVEWLGDYANNKLGLYPSTAAEVEREVMGDTKEAVFERQTRDRLDELYAQARRSHQDREWQAVFDLFDQIHVLDPAYPDPEGLLVSARASALYDQGLRHMEAEEWTQARQCLEELQRLEPGHRQTERLLSRISRELAKPRTVEVPDVSGENTSQASSTLDNRGLKLGAQNKVSSETIPEGGIVRQSPEAGTEVEAGSSVSVTVSSGPSTVVPDVSGKNLEEAERVLSSAGLVLEGSRTQKRREQAGTVISTDPPAGSEIDVGISVTPIVSSGPSVPAADPDVLPRRRRPKPDFLPGRKPKPK